MNWIFTFPSPHDDVVSDLSHVNTLHVSDLAHHAHLHIEHEDRHIPCVTLTTVIMSTEAAAPTASPPSSPKPVTADAAAIAEEAGADAEVPTADEAPIDTTMNDTNENDAAHSSSPPRPEDEPAATTSNTTTKTDPVIRPDLIEPRIPAKKDATLREFLGKMDDYAPIVRSLTSFLLATITLT